MSPAKISRWAKQGGWKRLKEEKQEEKATALPALTTEYRNATEIIDQSVESVIEHHRRMTLAMRQEWEANLGEYQSMLSFAAQFIDKSVIEELQAEGKTAEVLKHLKAAFTGLIQRIDMHAKLVATGGQVIDRERLVWGLAELDKLPSLPDWDRFLDELNKPVDMPSLPGKVLDFERKLKQHQGGSA